MNKLVLIGNGFDLAHNLKTKYSDFIFWYLNQIVFKISLGENFLDDNFELYPNCRFDKYEIRNVQDFKECLKNNCYEPKYLNSFIEKLLNKIDKNKWVDIEYFYYQQLVGYYKFFEERDNIDYLSKMITKLNKEFECIKYLLIKYLSEIKTKDLYFDNEISSHIKNIINSNQNQNDTVLFLNFNYTATINIYLSQFADKPNPKIIVNNIHGELGNSNNPIIFGYGDEKDLYYEKIERLQLDEMLSHFKSFRYFRTRHYIDLTSFIESSIFDVYILGLSCGTSDKVLLSSIFEHKYCRKIEILYHDRGNNENDYVDKTMAISRHFRPELKHEMRKKIVPLELSKPLKKHV